MFKKFSLFIILILIVSTNLFSQFSVNGDASSIGGGCYLICPDAQDNIGTIWNNTKLDISEPFNIEFVLNFGNDDGTADGMAFVIQDDPSGTSSIGTGGSRLGVETIVPSLGVEFDIYDSGATYGEVGLGDHFAIFRDGVNRHNHVENLAGPTVVPNLEDGNNKNIKITWDPATQVMDVYLNCNLIISNNYNIIDSVFSGNTMVWWGITGSTGWLHADLIACDVQIIDISVDDTVSICNGASALLDVTGPSGSYSWSPATGLSSTTIQDPTASPSQSTMYYVTYTDNCGLPITDSVFVEVTQSNLVDLGNDTTICGGSSLTLDAGSASSYIWSPGGQTSSTINVSSAGTYSVTVTDAGSCIDSDTIIVSTSPAVTADAGPDVSICTGNSTTLTAAGGTNYVWSEGSTTSSISVSPGSTTTYTVTVSDNNGCTDTDDVTVTVSATLNANAGNDVSICEGEFTSLTATGGTTYNWSTGDATQTITVAPSSTTTYTVTVSDGSGCTGTDDVIVTVNPLPNANAGTDQTICAGQSVTLTASGGTTYNWDNGVTQGVSFSPSSTTTYTVTVTDANGCTDTDQVIVTVSSGPNADAGPDVSICTGGSATLTASGGTTYLWSTGDATASTTVSPVSTTTYYVTVSDGSGCTDTDTVTVTVSSSLTANAGSDVSICEGEFTSLTASGGTTYNWSNGDATQTITVAPSSTTTYTVTVSDGSGCTGTDDVVVTVNPLPNADAGPDQTICAGQSVTLTATGGITFNWDNGVTQGVSFTPATTTTYTVTVTDANGCIDTDQVTVTVSAGPNADAGPDVSICTGGSTTLAASGGTNYLWSTGDVTSSITVSPTSTTTYYVTVSDGSGCTDSDTVTVSVSAALTADAGVDVSICDGEFTSLTASGGTSYLWSTGSTDQTITVSPPTNTTYYVTVSDGSGCSGTDDVLVTVYPLPSVNAGSDQSICPGESVTLSATGGATYSWDNGVTQGVSFTPAVTTTYTVTVTDTNGCSNSDQVTVTVNTPPDADAGQDISICMGGTVTLTASGGSSYFWSTNETTASINVSPTAMTSYYVTVTDDNGCTDADNVIVNVTPPIVADAGQDQTICEGISTSLTASGGSSYLWSNGDSGSTISVSPNNTTSYIVTVTDGPGCIDYDTVIVNVNNISAQAGPNSTICSGESVLLNSSGGITYQWSPPTGLSNTTSQNPVASPDVTTLYTVTVTDGNACTATATALISVVEAVELNFSLSSTPVCPGEKVVITPNIIKGIPPYQLYDDNNQALNPPITLYPTDSLTYTFYATDQCGTKDYATAQIGVYDLPEISFSAERLKGCEPLSISFNNNNYDSTQTVEWEFGDDQISYKGQNVTHTYNNPGVYDVTLNITSKDGCSGSHTEYDLIKVYEKPKAKFEAEPNVVSVIKPRVQFTNLSSYTDTCLWSFGDDDTSTAVNPYHDYPIYPTGKYKVRLIVSSSNGCRDSSFANIEVRNELTFYAPDAFSPDNDKINDVFRVFGNGIEKRSFKLMIFDRWGEKIYQTDDINKGWNGKINGNLCKSGVYTWLVLFRDFRNIQYEKSGKVTLIR